jgi:hypothetical protein
MIHLLALAGLGGVVLLVDLGAFGLGLRRRGMVSQLFPIFFWSLLGMIISGVLLVAAEPIRCYYHPAFRLKMVLFAAAILFTFTLHRRSVESKPFAILSLVLWIGVGLAGRAIGFL